MKVFLGGTYNNSLWRDTLIPMLAIDYFNPVVKDWTPECQTEELKQREECDYCLYVITPRMTGVYSIAEVVDDSNKRPEKTIFCWLSKDERPGEAMNPLFDTAQLRSLGAVETMVIMNGGNLFRSLEEVAEFLNHEFEKENDMMAELLKRGYL
jgi:hypothetical protein